MNYKKVSRKIKQQKNVRFLLNVFSLLNSPLKDDPVYREQFAYGHREVLLDFLNLPHDVAFKAVISHGNLFPSKFASIYPQYDLRGNMVKQIFWRLDAEIDALTKGIEAISIGAPGLYALENMGHSFGESINNLSSFSQNHKWSNEKSVLNEILEGKQILYMPYHSWEGDYIRHSTANLEFLKQIPNSTTSICLGYFDFVDPQCRKIYEENGFTLFCAGIRESLIPESPSGGRSKFLYSLLSKFKKYDAIISNELTTGQFYAACMNKIIGVLPEANTWELEFSSWQDKKSQSKGEDIVKNLYPWLYGKKHDPVEIYEDISLALGIKQLKDKEFLKKNISTFSML